MVFNRMLSQRFLSISRISNHTLTQCRTSSPSTAVEPAAFRRQAPPSKISPDPGDDGVFRRYFHRPTAAVTSGFRFMPTGEKLIEKLHGMDIAKDRIRLDGLIPPSPEATITVEDAKKILRLSQMETMMAKLRRIEKDVVLYPEFLEICAEECSNSDQSVELAKTLDESGSVIILGNMVFLKPEQVVRAVQALIPPPALAPGNQSLHELEELEKEKAVIDSKAESLVHRELWWGLGYMVVQTLAFMRLTFWELSWDVMEPICFYVTSIYFMGGYAFFLRTSKEPSFEGFFQSRFEVKQKRLMKARNFNPERYNELKKAFGYRKPSGPSRDGVSWPRLARCE